MGALLAVLAEVFELSAATGFTVDSILTGEAIVADELLQAYTTNLVALEGFTQTEALLAAGFSPEAAYLLTSLAPNFPEAFSLLAGAESVVHGSLFIGAATSAALTPYSYDYATPIADLNQHLMALQVWRPEDWEDIYFPGVLPFARFVNYIDPANWASNLYHAIGRYFWESAQRAGTRLIEQEVRHVSTDLAQRTVTSIAETLSYYFENARWAVSHLSSNIYGGLQQYYSELPPLRPHQVRALHKRLGEKIPDRFNLESSKGSAQYVDKYDSPGGARQRHTPDWMLPLILGLYGDILPSWETTLEELEAEEDGPQKKKPRSETHRRRRKSQSSA
ncbi:VP2 minor capsid protein [Bat polyomavirus 6b]|uniref:Minor capsid protein n=1 Tax=Bat polyomavirus 6b TaxID=1623689 RepID=A0A0D5ZYF2_9POLY|nr:VP2 minor capsid protein [Bat polyomavirus 6b]BAQ55574.1 VP2 minor capsid protein [Bat polyomavirus 6b]